MRTKKPSCSSPNSKRGEKNEQRGLGEPGASILGYRDCRSPGRYADPYRLSHEPQARPSDGHDRLSPDHDRRACDAGLGPVPTMRATQMKTSTNRDGLHLTAPRSDNPWFELR